MSKITHVKLENFTAFALLDQSFCTGVNVLIGVNGTGKTHLLKVLYAACAITVGEDAEKSYGAKLCNVFKPYEGRVGRLMHRQSTGTETAIAITRDGQTQLSVSFRNNASTLENITAIGEADWKKHPLESTYIPVKEMLAHAPGFLATVSRREIAFEDVYTDIIKRAFLPKLTETTDPGSSRLLAVLQETLGGKVTTQGEHFFLKRNRSELEFTLLAEGVRKLALIWLLIQNGTLSAGSVLFWDEPEANLNPSLMGAVVEVILELQRLGVQVFLTTHNYVLLKEFDLRKKDQDIIRYISLFRDETGAVSANAGESYANIDPNAIAGTFSDLYDRELKRNLGGMQT